MHFGLDFWMGFCVWIFWGIVFVCFVVFFNLGMGKMKQLTKVPRERPFSVDGLAVVLHLKGKPDTLNKLNLS